MFLTLMSIQSLFSVSIQENDKHATFVINDAIAPSPGSPLKMAGYCKSM